MAAISPAPGGQLAAIGPGEFTKLVYESTFTKCPKGMSFVNARIEPGPPPKYHADSSGRAGRKPYLFRELSDKMNYVIDQKE